MEFGNDKTSFFKSLGSFQNHLRSCESFCAKCCDNCYFDDPGVTYRTERASFWSTP